MDISIWTTFLPVFCLALVLSFPVFIVVLEILNCFVTCATQIIEHNKSIQVAPVEWHCCTSSKNRHLLGSALVIRYMFVFCLF